MEIEICLTNPANTRLGLILVRNTQQVNLTRLQMGIETQWDSFRHKTYAVRVSVVLPVRLKKLIMVVTISHREAWSSGIVDFLLYSKESLEWVKEFTL